MADAFGRMVADYHHESLADEPVYERSDAEESPAHCAWYFAGPEDWGPLEASMLDACRGRVLDAGCGPGRVLRVLADRGHEVLGVDASPGAVAVAREWTGQPVIVGDMHRLPIAAGSARSAVFLGTHVGAPGSIEGVRALLAECDRILVDDAAGDGHRILGGERAGDPTARVVADIYDPTAVEDPELRAYLEERWLAEGVATRRFRLRYDGALGDWRTLLQCSPAGLERIVAPTAWSIAEVERGEGTRYAFVLERSD